MTGEKILVVEDDEALLGAVRDILEFAGYRVMTASNGKEGLAALDREQPELIVSDIMMPHMDGYQFYEAVRTRPECLGIPFIFMTAKGEKLDIRRGKQLGADDYVVKPFDEEDLLVAVQSKLSRRAQLDRAREQQVEDLKRTILVTLNHEFRTPLTYITSYTELLKDSGSEMSDADFKSVLHGIQVGSERLRRLVEDFILLVELQAGEAQRIFERRRAPLPDLSITLLHLLRRFEAAAAARQVQLLSDLPDGLPILRTDPEYLANAVGRLVDNAIKFSKKNGGRVRLSARATPQGVAIAVQDEGVGIKPEVLDRLFDVFYQIDRAKHEQQGSGSGLAIARGIAQLHGGRLTVASELGVGSTFTLELPAEPEA